MIIRRLSFWRVIRGEILKTRRTRGLLLAILGPLAVTGIVVALYIDNAVKADPDVSPWMGFSRQVFNFYFFLYPLFAALLGFMLSKIEHKNGGFKHIFTLPAPKSYFYFSKVMILLGWLGLSLLCALAFLVIAGGALHAFIPDYAFAQNALPTSVYVFLFRLFVSLISIVAIHFFLSLYFDNFIVAVGSAVFLLVFGMVAVNHESAWLIPYTYPLQHFMGFMAGDTTWVDQRSWVSLGYGLVFFTAGYWLVSRKNIK